MEIIKEEKSSPRLKKDNSKVHIKHSKTSNNLLKFANNIKNEEEQEITRKLTKTKSTAKRTSSYFNIILTKEDVYKFLSKNTNSRTAQEINTYAKYLSNKFQYFTKLKEEDSQMKVEKLTKVCKLQKTLKGDSIINYGEIGDKFYIVLEGVVEIYKPIYIDVALTPNEFIKKLENIKKMDGTDLRYNRIKNKNKTFFDSLSDKNMSFGVGNFMKYKQVFVLEEEEKLGEFKEGFSFGDIALIKKTVRNATIKAKENCILLTIEKDDYKKALLEFQRKKLSKDIDIFLKTYSFFKYFSHDRIINLFNCFNTKEIFKGEYLYKQNIQDDSIYFINYGTFSIDCLISFSWINDYFNYINYSGKNILQYLIKTKNRKINELVKMVRECLSKNSNYTIQTIEKNELWEKIIERELHNNFYKLKKDEEKLNDPEHIFNINLKKINYNEILGLEEVFEFKKRFCSCKCLSEKGEIKSIRITDFLKLIINFGEEELNYFINMIEEKKKLLKYQILKGIKSIEKKLIFNFDTRYENIIKSLNSDKNENDKEKTHLIFSTIKMKGYKNSIDELLDNSVPKLEKEDKKSQYRKILKTRKNRSIDQVIYDYGLKKSTNNEFKLKKTKTIFEMDNKTRNENNQNKNFNESLRMDSIYDLLNKSKTTTMKINNSNNGNIKYINKISLNNFTNKSLNTNDSFKSEIRKNRKLNSNIIKTKNNFFKNLGNKYSYDKINLSSEKSKLISETPNIKITKFNSNDKKYKLGRNASVHNFNFKNKKISVKKSITTYDSFNLPKLNNQNFFIKTNLDESTNINNLLLIKENKNYNNFYNIFNEDKNFFLGVEFQKKLKKEYIYNEKPIKSNMLKL